MKKRAHIPHNYEMSYENCQGTFYARGSGVQPLEKGKNCLIKRRLSYSFNGRFCSFAMDGPLDQFSIPPQAEEGAEIGPEYQVKGVPLHLMT